MMNPIVVKSHNKTIGVGMGLCVNLMVVGHSACP